MVIRITISTSNTEIIIDDMSSTIFTIIFFILENTFPASLVSSERHYEIIDEGIPEGKNRKLQDVQVIYDSPTD